MFFSFLNVKAQNFNEKWGVGLNAASVLYSKEDKGTVGGRYIATLPGFSVSRYIGNRMTVSMAFSNSINDSQQYFSSDFHLTYDIFSPEGILRPYLLGGVGVVNLLDTGLTLNFGAGGTLWIFDNIGLNAQLFYKGKTLGGDLQRSHIFASGGIVYSFSSGRSKRLWDK